MSKYSFIEAELNIPGKQCFCIDINNSNTPFTYGSQINSLPSDMSTPLLAPTPTPLSAPAPLPSDKLGNPLDSRPESSSSNQTYLLNNMNKNLFNVETTYLLGPDSKAINGDREKQIIQTVNNLLTSAVSDINNQTNTVNNFKDDDNVDNTNVDDLNKIANRGKKKYKSKSKSLNLLQEGFEQNKCNDTCSIKKSYNKNKSFLNSDNIIIILLLIVIAYLFYNKK
jgi:hypothetical protein